jgi:hypothetical protein
MDYAPQVYDRFSRGLRRDQKINLIMEFCRQQPMYFGVFLEDKNIPPSNLRLLRDRLRSLLISGLNIDLLCRENFTAVYNKFTYTLRLDVRINLLLDYCRREPSRLQALSSILDLDLTREDSSTPSYYTIQLPSISDSNSQIPVILRDLYTLFDASDFDAFCLDYFPSVYDKFDRGLCLDHKKELLLKYCRDTDSLSELTRLLQTKLLESPPLPADEEWPFQEETARAALDFTVVADHNVTRVLPVLRRELLHLSDHSIACLCFDHYFKVYGNFTRTMFRNEQITALLDHCRRSPSHLYTLLELLGIRLPQNISFEDQEIPSDSLSATGEELNIPSDLLYQLSQMNSSNFNAFCLDYFPYIYNRFGSGMTLEDKKALLLDHLASQATGLERLKKLLQLDLSENAASESVINDILSDTDINMTNLKSLRIRLNRFDDLEIDVLCLDHFFEVYDRFSVGLNRSEKVTLLLDHCRRHPSELQKLNMLIPMST